MERPHRQCLELTLMLRYLLDIYIGLSMEHNVQNPILGFAIVYRLPDA